MKQKIADWLEANNFILDKTIIDKDRGDLYHTYYRINPEEIIVVIEMPDGSCVMLQSIKPAIKEKYYA